MESLCVLLPASGLTWSCFGTRGFRGQCSQCPAAPCQSSALPLPELSCRWYRVNTSRAFTSHCSGLLLTGNRLHYCPCAECVFPSMVIGERSPCPHTNPGALFLLYFLPFFPRDGEVRAQHGGIELPIPVKPTHSLSAVQHTVTSHGHVSWKRHGGYLITSLLF